MWLWGAFAAAIAWWAYDVRQKEDTAAAASAIGTQEAQPQGLSIGEQAAQQVAQTKEVLSAYRASVGGDATLAAVLGLPPEVTGVPQAAAAAVASTQAANSAKLQAINDQIIALQQHISDLNAAYSRDHYGGQSADQFAAIVAAVQAQIVALQQQAQGVGL